MSETFTYLPPSDDGIFKTLLTHPDATNALRSVISSFTKLDVQQVAVVNNELHISDIDEKRERFDVNCVVDRSGDGTGGKQIEVEMQAEAMKGDNTDNEHKNMTNRIVSYLCDLHAKQKGEGVIYSELMPSIQITICDYTLLPNEDSFINAFSLRNENGHELNKAISLIIVELSKLANVMKKSVSEMTDAEKWAVFFKYADKPKYTEVVNAIAADKGEIMEATRILTNISTDENERAKFRAREKFRRDMAHNMLVGIREAREEEQAKASSERIKSAKALLSNGVSLEIVIKSINLTIDEAEKLRKE
ncbi:hypothetical protein FACS1894120_6470 [Clostridia bacterium]|nr:hypothetical protein FACS1894120_6470 [Clostridia bacterium]